MVTDCAKYVGGHREMELFMLSLCLILTILSLASNELKCIMHIIFGDAGNSSALKSVYQSRVSFPIGFL